MADHEDSKSQNKQTFLVSYDGKNKDVNAMDVASLAPALAAFGRLVRESNICINKKKSSLKVYVKGDFENKCFNIRFEVVQDIFQKIGSLLRSEEVKTAKEVLQDLGVILGPPALGLIAYLKWKAGRTVISIYDTDDQGVVVVQLGDGSRANVLRNAVELSKSSKIRTAVEGTLSPIGLDGIDTVSFFPGDGGLAAATIDEASSKAIVVSFDIPQGPDETPQEDEEEPPVVAWLRVLSPVFDPKAPKWDFLYQGRKITADITGTAIGSDTMLRGGVAINDLYKVEMIVKAHFTPSGQERHEYRIVRVLEFVPSPSQRQLPL